MSSLKQQIRDDMKSAMKAREKEKLMTIRTLLSEIKNFEIDNGEQDNAGIQVIISRMVKQWKDAIEEYKKGDRSDLVEESEKKIEILQNYLPEQMNEEELKKIIQEVIAGSEQKKAGPIIGQVISMTQGQADGKMIAKLVNQMLRE